MKANLPEEYLKIHRLKLNEIDAMKRLRLCGLSYCEIAKLFHTSRSLVRYHCDEIAKQQTIKSSKESQSLNKERVLERGKIFKIRFKEIVGVRQETLINRYNKKELGIIVKPYKDLKI